jgi:hypothetical protein
MENKRETIAGLYEVVVPFPTMLVRSFAVFPPLAQRAFHSRGIITFLFHYRGKKQCVIALLGPQIH